jgi:hypothetical protein
MSKPEGEVALSERDRFWQEHHEAQVASGQSGKVYAAERDLPLPARIRAEVRAYDVVQCDETPFQVLKEAGTEPFVSLGGERRSSRPPLDRLRV